MKLYHVTTRQDALLILADGWRDRPAGIEDADLRGVWLWSRPLGRNDGVVSSTVLELDVNEDDIRTYEVVVHGAAYRSWLVPAAVVTQHAADAHLLVREPLGEREQAALQARAAWLAREVGRGEMTKEDAEQALNRLREKLERWEPPEPEALPTLLVGSPRTRPGVLRVWPAGGGVVTLQGLFADAPRDSAAVPVLLEVHLSWGGRTGRGPTAEAALRSLRTAGAVAAPGDTSLDARWSAVRRLAAQADSALAAGDLERFGGLWAQLRRLLDVQRRLAPPTARP